MSVSNSWLSLSLASGRFLTSATSTLISAWLNSTWPRPRRLLPPSSPLRPARRPPLRQHLLLPALPQAIPSIGALLVVVVADAVAVGEARVPYRFPVAVPQSLEWLHPNVAWWSSHSSTASWSSSTSPAGAHGRSASPAGTHDRSSSYHGVAPSTTQCPTYNRPWHAGSSCLGHLGSAVPRQRLQHGDTPLWATRIGLLTLDHLPYRL